jgi:hypothetical protein
LPGSKHLTLAQIKDILRSYLTLIYSGHSPWCTSNGISLLVAGKSANNAKAHVPWAAISQDPDRFIDLQYLPDNTTIAEISRMRAAPLLECYRRWRKAQKHGRTPFRFKFVLPQDKREHAHKRKKGKAPRKKKSDSSDEAGSSDEEMPPKKKQMTTPPATSDHDQDSSGSEDKQQDEVTDSGLKDPLKPSSSQPKPTEELERSVCLYSHLCTVHL